MTDARLPIGARRAQALVASLDEIRAVLEEFQDESHSVNDQRLRPATALVIEATGAVLTAHSGSPKPSIAGDLAGLMSAVRALKIPARDPDLGRTPTLDRLRSKQGLMIAGLADALEAAAAMGLRPQQPPLPQELAAEIPRSEVEGLLRGILRRLSYVEESLDALTATQSASTEFKQQIGLVNFYTESMRAEADLIKLQIGVGGSTIDFNALSRAVEAMAGLTRDFVTTARAWTDRIAPAVLRVAVQIPSQVRRVARGVRVTAMRVVGLARRYDNTAEDELSSNLQVARDSDQALAGLGDPPDDFDLDKISEMILRGEAPSPRWRPYVKHLSFIGTKLAQLAALAGLANLQSLGLRETQVSDIAPLAGLANLHRLYLQGTQVSDLAPLAGLANLESLDLQGTQVSDLAALAGLANLQRLSLRGTQVSDLAPLAGLANLQSLDLRETRVSDLAPLADLASLRQLYLDETQVSDLAPLAGLANLQGLSLDGTQVSDLAPLADLANLQQLYLHGTQVNNFAPVAHVSLVITPGGRELRRK